MANAVIETKAQRVERLKRETREALIELAAVVADGFPSDQRRSNEHFV